MKTLCTRGFLFLIFISAGNNVKCFSSNSFKKDILSMDRMSFFYQDSFNFNKELKNIDSISQVKDGFGIALEKALELDIRDDLSTEERYELSFKIASIYHNTNQYSRSLEYFLKSLNLLKSDSLIQEETSSNQSYKQKLAFLYLKIGAAFQKLELKDSAKVYYKALDSIDSFSGKIESYKAVSYSNLSGIYETDSIYDKAEYYSKRSLKIHRDNGDILNESIALNNLGNLYLSQGLYKKSKKIYLEAIELIEKNNSALAVRYKASLYANLAWAMRNLKEYEAYDALYDSYEIKDELRRKDIQQIVENVTRKHSVDIVKKEAEVQATKASRRTWIIIGSSILIITILSFLLHSFKLRQKNLGLKLKRKEAEKQRELSQLKAESQALILNAALDGKESERKQIAETLHDNVSTLLSSANLHLQACKTQFNGNTPEEVDKTQVIINEASQKIRDLSHTLVSSILLKFGLSFAVNDLIKKYSNSQIQFDGEIQSLPRFKQNFEIKVYNIIQELVNNVLKHSQATEAQIELKEVERRLLISISDNGRGFDKTKITVKDGIGINQIDARIQMMKGKFQIDSKINRGTTVKIELPIHELERVKTA